LRTTDWLGLLAPHAARLADASIARLLASDPASIRASSQRVGPIFASFARQRIDRAAWDALWNVAQLRGVGPGLSAMFDGEHVNLSENRPALHTALRSDLGAGTVAASARASAAAARVQMQRWIAELDASPVTDIVNVGIGGSDLGPRLALEALRDFDRGRYRVHFLSNVDGNAAHHLLRGLDPARTAVILVSKTFSTQETLLNGAILRAWLGGEERLFAVSANVERALALGIDARRVLPMWDWVGGRYSVWSAVGVSIALALGMTGFDAMLAGAALMDEHVYTERASTRNLAIRHALCAVWNRNALGCATQAVMPYDDRLARLPAYLQQLVMESLGKRVARDGGEIHHSTVPVVWGGPGTDSQHSFFQALHQGTDTVPIDFIGVVHATHGHDENHRALLANLLAQSEAMANGEASHDPHRTYPGNRPSTLLLLDRLDPSSFGALLALYEHSVYVQSLIWDINAFDQWGVELGKRLATQLLPALQTDDGIEIAVDDPVTRALLAQIRGHGI
jgi:glucose-6-phosphate isomerase